MQRATRILVILGLTVFAMRPAAAQLPDVVSYQGYLEQAGEPVNDPAARLIFKIYTNAEGGTALWTEQHLNVPVVEGVFSVLLGSVNAVGFQGLPFGEPLWLSVNPGAGELIPRTPLAAVPYSLSTRGIRVAETTSEPEHAPNIIAGHPSNVTTAGVNGATISGGGYHYLTNDRSNRVTDNYGTIGGGMGNQAGDAAGLTYNERYATVCGGQGNTARRLGSTVAGGIDNDAGGVLSFVGSGDSNRATGGQSTVGGGQLNLASGLLSTVSGGDDNYASGDYSTIGGGSDNLAGRLLSTVGGGLENIARGDASTVPGGRYNVASGDLSLAAGYNAKARHEGSFVWNDRSQTALDHSDSLHTTATNQFLIRAAGGTGIGTNAPSAHVHILGDSDGLKPHLFLQETSAGDYARLRLQNSDGQILPADYWDIAAGAANTEKLNFFTRNVNVVTFWPDDNTSSSYPNLITTSAGTARLTQGGVWTNASSEAAKTDFRAFDAMVVLERVVGLKLREWRYRVEPAHVRHIGPTAEEFFAAFGLGDSDQSIGTVDADGVALAAIQGLYELVKEQQAEIEVLRQEIELMKKARHTP